MRVHACLVLILDTSIDNTLKLHDLLTWCTNNACYSALKSSFNYQKDTLKSNLCLILERRDSLQVWSVLQEVEKFQMPI